MTSKCGGYSFFAIIWVLFFDLYDSVEPTASAWRDINIFALADFANFTVDCGFFGHAHEELVFVFAGQNSLINGVLPVRDAFNFDDWLLACSVNNACQV